MSVIPFNGRETLYDGSGANKERLKEEPHVGGGVILHLHLPKWMYNQALISCSSSDRQEESITSLPSPKCLPPTPPPPPDPATLSVVFYLQSACCPYVTLIVAIILGQQGSFYKSRVRREWQRIHFNKKPRSDTLMGWHPDICIEMNYGGTPWRDF